MFICAKPSVMDIKCPFSESDWLDTLEPRVYRLYPLSAYPPDVPFFEHFKLQNTLTALNIIIPDVR